MLALVLNPTHVGGNWYRLATTVQQVLQYMLLVMNWKRDWVIQAHSSSTVKSIITDSPPHRASLPLVHHQSQLWVRRRTLQIKWGIFGMCWFKPCFGTNFVSDISIHMNILQPSDPDKTRRRRKEKRSTLNTRNSVDHLQFCSKNLGKNTLC